ncbi:hypothetical protein PYCCODRAFT_1440564 [Trametes coccinea BRFM310]|uniref:Uncharacterized protein n=1 Tax=Trametes coccinea (strain BRFM310) TaxID=1353009 RepID=A0A1Y2I7B7_TRAC3|nr:hypothetical protein PYCCODRAFT_1440564 [Trametes coccinea BRFM310]
MVSFKIATLFAIALAACVGVVAEPELAARQDNCDASTQTITDDVLRLHCDSHRHCFGRRSPPPPQQQ